MILFDISPLAGGIGIGIAIFLFLVCALIAFVAFKMLKKTAKTAVRIVIVFAILFVALIGGIALILITSGGLAKPDRPPVKKTK